MNEKKRALGLIPEPEEVEKQKIYVRYLTPEESVEEVVAEEAEKLRKILEMKKSVPKR